jgi:hypothetical protein
VAQRGEERRGKIRFLPHDFCSVTVLEKLGALDRDCGDSGHSVERANVEPRRDRRQHANRLGALSQRNE